MEAQNSASYFASSFNPAYEYGPSFFDRTHVFNLTYNYDLPFGAGHRLGSSAHESLNKIIGGWFTSGIFRADSGAPLTVVQGQSGSSLGGGLIFGFPQAAIPLANPSSLGGGLNALPCAGPGNPGSTADGPGCQSLYPPGTTLNGTGHDYFKDPSAVLKNFRPILLASDGRTGRSRPLRGFGLWNFDLRVGKETKFRERYSFEFSAALFNAFNHVNFQDPTLDLTNLPTFGVVSQSLTPANRNASSRWVQLGLRFNF